MVSIGIYRMLRGGIDEVGVDDKDEVDLLRTGALKESVQELVSSES